MDLRLRSLEQLDPRAVALPHGTEVVTRVDRIVGERRIPQGSIGRVTKANEESIDVTIVGVGVVRYARGELSPRRVGQMLYAQRRADAWEALERCIVLDTTVGSRAWGLADESSDTDRRGVFALPFTWTQGLVAPPEDLVSADGSATFWAAGKAVRQALRADPNTLEMLFLPNAKALDPIGEWILAERDAFVSIEIYGTFGRYALGQLRRLEQGLRLAGRLEANDLSALVKLAQTEAASLELPRELRPKNAYNLIRLLATATRWLREGTPTFEVEGELRALLFAIKKGEVSLDDVLAEAEAMAPELERARDASRLPKRPDVARADALLRRIGEELARRWANGASGPFASDAPPAPEVTWSE
ncbi:hypothetical protein BH09MYX1_BH09MYX1_46940 [soil metagenome]